LIDCLSRYERYGGIDEELWELFLEDFEGWTETLFALGNKAIREPLRDFLRENGVFVGGTKYTSQQLFNLLQEEKYQEWPAEDIAKQMDSGLEIWSYQNPIFCATMENGDIEAQVKELPQPLDDAQKQLEKPSKSKEPPFLTTDPVTTTRDCHEVKADFASLDQTPPFPPSQGLRPPKKPRHCLHHKAISQSLCSPTRLSQSQRRKLKSSHPLHLAL
jgi:hypothetical protein